MSINIYIYIYIVYSPVNNIQRHIRKHTQATDNYHTIIYNVNRKIKIPKVYLEVVN
jgi:hypothetical protein